MNETTTPTTSATLLSKNGILTREELKDLPTPPATKTHKPIPHYELITTLIDTLAYRKISPVREQYSVSPDGMKFFGVMELANDDKFTDGRYALGIRNSNDKSFALGVTVGYKVTVCDNLGFWGEYDSAVARKHTSKVRLEELLSLTVDNIQRNYTPMLADINRWKDTRITDNEAKLAIYDAFNGERTSGLQRHLMLPIHEYYFNPPHHEFADRNLWSLQNAFTGAAKELDPIRQQIAAAQIGEYFKQRQA